MMNWCTHTKKKKFRFSGFNYLHRDVISSMGLLNVFTLIKQHKPCNPNIPFLPHQMLTCYHRCESLGSCCPVKDTVVTGDVGNRCCVSVSLAPAVLRPVSVPGFGDTEKLAHTACLTGASLVAQLVKNLPTMQETWVWSWGQEDPLEKEMATDSSILTWKIHGQRSLLGYSPGGCKSWTWVSN